MTTQKKMIRLNRTDTFKVMQWMTEHRETLEPKTATQALKLMREAGWPDIPNGMYNRMRNDLSWNTSRPIDNNNTKERLKKLEKQVDDLYRELREIDVYLSQRPWKTNL